MGLLILRTAAARHYLKLSSTDYLIEVSHAALDCGIYAYGLGEIATLGHPPGYATFAEVGPLFDSALDELDIRVTNWEQALDIVIEDYMLALAEGGRHPQEITRQAYEDDNVLVYDHRKKWQRPTTPLSELVNFYYQYDHLFYITETEDTLDRQCIELARKWCRNRWCAHLDPAWLTPTVVAISQCISEERAFDRLPILADALQDAGCDSDDILNHCRALKHVHVRGCWVVDLVLGKE